ncbi:hypothetical protein EOD39_14030 [Acipenser ruthenus]|uniref:Uncharacterized protein n=1 Tax=Acipenser ruthenus TaxID=7906 RepID=A0A662YNZ9_ACIRT|nr:hypothetical protein EOD39_14030 [Acipenser ruthenus]
MGLDEGSEGENAIDFLTKALPRWVPSLLGKSIEIMRAHCIYTDKSRMTTTYFNLLRYTDHQLILQAARKASLHHIGKGLRFYPDFSNYIAQCRQAFSQLMRLARAQGLQDFLLYPLALKIHDPLTHLFQSLTEAQDFLNTTGIDGSSRPCGTSDLSTAHTA